MADGETADMRGLAVARLVIGLLQGLVLYLLYSAYDAQSWPATNGLLFAPLALMAFYVPLLAIQGLGNIRLPVLIVWLVAAAALVAGLAWYDIWHAWPWDYVYREGVGSNTARTLPTPLVFAFTGAMLFIAHALVSSADADRRFHADYPTYFDVAWKGGVQLALAVAFVGAFWLLLWLGAELFQLIKLDFLEKLIEHRWFAIPVTALATAMALHLTDVRAGLVRGARTLALVLLSWLLPLMALFAVGFLLSLVFTGLQPLWDTRSAAALLLVSAAVLVILINANYQDGESERHAAPFVLKIATRVAGVALVPIVALAAYAISLRVRQYGWTDDRVASAAVTAVALGYAAAYAMSALLPGPWMKRIEGWNFLMALVSLGVLIALFSPIADPARIAVNSQMARLRSGAVTPDKFDFGFLRSHGQRFGYDALQNVQAHTKDARIKAMVADLLTRKTLYTPTSSRLTLAQIDANVTVYPKGAKLPGGIAAQPWAWGPAVPDCLLYPGQKCDAFIRDLDGDGRDEVIFTAGSGENIGKADLLTQGADGKWIGVGVLSEPRCQGALKALQAGTFAPMTVPPRWRDIDANGVVLRFEPVAPPGDPSCPAKK